MMTTQKQVRDAFWESTHAAFGSHGINARRPGWSQNQYPSTIRCAFVDFVDHLARDGQISEALAQRVTL